jgi:hypothetical protein
MPKLGRIMDSRRVQGSSYCYRTRPFSPGQALHLPFFPILRSFGTHLGIICKFGSTHFARKSQGNDDQYGKSGLFSTVQMRYSTHFNKFGKVGQSDFGATKCPVSE